MGAKQAVAPCVGLGETDRPLGEAHMSSVQGSGIETGGRRAFLDEVSQDLEDLRGVGDHGDDFHGLVTTRAAQGVRLVDLLDQAGPCGAALPGRHRQLWQRLVGRTDAGRWLGLMVALPTLGSEAEEVRATGPPSRRASAGSRRSFGTAAAYDLPGQVSRGRVRNTGRRYE